MSTTPSQFLTFATEKENNSSVSLKSLFAKYIYNSPFILITVVVMLAVAFVYVQVADPVYQVRASLLVTTPNTNDKPNESQSVLDKIDLPNNSDIVENEIAKLKSAKLINQVINDLQLTISYQQKKSFFYKDLYQDLPFKLVMIKSNTDLGNNIKTIIKVKNSQSFLLKTGGEDFKEYTFNDVIHSDIGTWKLIPLPTISSFNDAIIKISMLDPDKLVEQYQKNIDASLQDKLATAIDLSFTTNDKQKGKDIINHLIEVYNADEIDDKNKETQNTIKFIDQRLASLTGELSGVEKDIANFKSVNKLTDITSDAKFALDNLQSNDNRLNEINVQLSIVDGIDRYVNATHNNERPPAVIGINDPSLINSVEKLSQLQLRHDQMLVTMPETNPDFEDINTQIKTTKAAIKQNVKNIRSSLLNAQSKLKDLSSGSESTISNLPGKERQFISIKRQQSIKENLYVYLLQKREEVSLSYASTVSNYKVLDTAHSLPSKWPNSKLIYAVALLLGIILPAIFIYARQLLKGVIIDPWDIENALGLPVFSEISFAGSSAIVAKEGLVAEQFRSLRTKLSDLHQNKQLPVVTLITSSTPNEGKSFIASNLAVTLAGANKKTILVELDLRRSAITEVFNLQKKHAGVSDFLSGKATFDKIIQPSGVNTLLDVISSGSPSLSPADLLENGKLADLITKLKDSYNEILIYTAPVHLVTDAHIIARFCDVPLYIVRQGATKKSELKFIKSLLQDDKLAKMQIVFNGVNIKKYGYGYAYDHSYYKSAPGASV